VCAHAETATESEPADQPRIIQPERRGVGNRRGDKGVHTRGCRMRRGPRKDKGKKSDAIREGKEISSLGRTALKRGRGWRLNSSTVSVTKPGALGCSRGRGLARRPAMARTRGWRRTSRKWRQRELPDRNPLVRHSGDSLEYFGNADCIYPTQ